MMIVITTMMTKLVTFVICLLAVQLNTTNLLLQTLACVDTAYLVACLFIQTTKTLVDATDWLPSVLVAYVPRLEPFVWPAASCAQTATVWTVLLLTADRYAAVCHPFDARLRSLQRARAVEILPRRFPQPRRHRRGYLYCLRRGGKIRKWLRT